MSDLSTNGSFATVKKIMSNNDPKTIPFIRSGNCGETFINIDDLEYISELSHIQLPKSTTQLNDIMMARKGKIGGASIITENEVNYNCSENVIKLTIKNKMKFNPFYFTVYFNSKYGLKQIERLSTGNVQPWVSIFQIRKLLIPELNDYFQTRIASLVQQSYQNLEDSKQLYKEAETLVLRELDLLDFEPSKEKVSIKSFSESYGSSGRFDSEYYQPKYNEIIEKIREYKNSCEPINISCNLKDKNYTPKNDEYYKYIELSNISHTGSITGCTYEIGKKLPSRARRLIKENDVIISSIEGSLEKIAIVRKEFDNSLCSTGFYVINSKKLNSETLLVLFKNKIMQQVLKQNCSGTILTAMNKEDFLNIDIPIIDKEIQIQIEDNIQESFKLREESKYFLEIAKKAVEIAIKENEEKAMEFIDAKI